MRPATFPLLALVVSCAGEAREPDGGSLADAGAGDVVEAPRDGAPPACQDERFLERLPSPEAFTCMQGEGWAVKYLAEVAGRRAPRPLDKACAFQNTAIYAGHIRFVTSFPELAHVDFDTYLALVMRNRTRVWWAGELKLLPGAAHPRTGRRGVMALFVYAGDDEEDALSIDQIAEAYARVAECAPYTREMLVVVGANAIQSARFAALAPALRARGIEVADARTLRPDIEAEGYSLGESYGFLKLVPRGDSPADYGPRDIVIAESSPEDLSLVAGLLTALPQNLHSHVNLRLREKRIPNAHVPGLHEDEALRLLDGKLARLRVEAQRVRVEAATLADAEAFWATRRPSLPPPRADLDEGRVRTLAVLGAGDALAYGAKAANLAELRRAIAGANTVPGLAIPFSAYREFVRQSGLEARIEAMLADMRFRSDAPWRRQQLAALRQQIEAAPLPPGLLDRIRDGARDVFGAGFETTPLRFRSSSNLEDGLNGSGAGLHDSARGCFADEDDADDRGPSACLSAEERAALEAELVRRREQQRATPDRAWLASLIEDLTSDLTKERSISRAVRKVFASLWNDRAFEERESWGVDHRLVFMGIAVNPAFVLERLDAVAVTQLPVAEGAPLYRVVSQRGGVGVVRPADPTAIAETLTLRREAGDVPTDLRVVVMSSLAEGPLWTRAQQEHLARLLFTVHDHFATHVYPQIARLSLDLELKLTGDERIVIKQARPYLQHPP